jgi:Spy/CpxP family protein refolding chaperone
MARYSAWALAALLTLPAYSRAEEACVRGQAQPPKPQQSTPQQSTPQPSTPQPLQDAKNGGDQGHQRPPHWWIEPQLRQQLAITDSQSKSVEEIWQKSIPELRKLRGQLMALQDQVSKMVDDGAAEAAVTAQIEQTENTRAQYNKLRTLMIYRMNRVLNADQRAKVKAISPPLYDDHRGDGRRSGGTR